MNWLEAGMAEQERVGFDQIELLAWQITRMFVTETEYLIANQLLSAEPRRQRLQRTAAQSGAKLSPAKK